jgi:hypothetical protein
MLARDESRSVGRDLIIVFVGFIVIDRFDANSRAFALAFAFATTLERDWDVLIGLIVVLKSATIVFFVFVCSLFGSCLPIATTFGGVKTLGSGVRARGSLVTVAGLSSGIRDELVVLKVLSTKLTHD